MRIVGSNPNNVYWMDIFPHWFVVNIVPFVYREDENEQKEAGMPILKIQIVSLPYLLFCTNYFRILTA